MNYLICRRYDCDCIMVDVEAQGRGFRRYAGDYFKSPEKEWAGVMEVRESMEMCMVRIFFVHFNHIAEPQQCGHPSPPQSLASPLPPPQKKGAHPDYGVCEKRSTARLWADVVTGRQGLSGKARWA